MLRRKKEHQGSPVESESNLAGPPGGEESMRVLAAFMAEPGSGPAGSVAGPGPSTPTWSGSNPPPAPPLSGTWEGPTAPPPPPLQTGARVGVEGPSGRGPQVGGPTTVPIPGAGPVSPDRVQQTVAYIGQLVAELSGGADLHQRWTRDQVHTALSRLETRRSEGGVTEEQYQALRAALQSMLIS